MVSCIIYYQNKILTLKDESLLILSLFEFKLLDTMTISYSYDNNCLFYYSNESQSAAMPACTLEFSSICLQNGLLLLKAGETLLEASNDTAMENHVDLDDNDVLEVNGTK